MVFIGMDHGTTGISFCIMSDDGEVVDVFKLEGKKVNRAKYQLLKNCLNE